MAHQTRSVYVVFSYSSWDYLVVLQKGFANLILLLLVIVGIAVGIYLLQYQTVFKPQASEGTPDVSAQAKIPTLAFVFFGESNSGGLASNDNATDDELAATPSVQILNNTSFNFENLDIGYNNLIDHDGLPGASVIDHGLELQLANSVKAQAFPNNSQVYLVKTGQGGSVVAQWLNEIPGNLYWTKFLERTFYAKTKIPTKPVQWIVWYSLGINDHIGNPCVNPPIPRTSSEVYKSKATAIIQNIKAQLPGAIIIMTQFQAQNNISVPCPAPYPQNIYFDTNFTDYNAVLSQIAASEPNVYVVDTTGSTLRPDTPMHWDYGGFKTVGSRMVDITNNALQTVNVLSASPNPCILNSSQLCTSKISWNFPGITDLKITVRENPGSVISYQLATGSLDVPWISASGATFDVYSGDTLLRSVFVKGAQVVASASPSSSPQKKGDLDGDGYIDIFDYNIFLRDFVVKNLRSDIDADGDVDIFDFNLIIRNFGK